MDEIGPDILKEEIIAAIRDLNNSKAEGINNIPAEMLRNLDEGATR